MPYNKKQKHDWYVKHEEQLKKRRDIKREQKGKKDFILVQFNRHKRSYEARHDMKWFPFIRTDWVEWFLNNTEFNHVYNNWERAKFDSNVKPQIEKKKKMDKWEFCNLQTKAYNESSLGQSREATKNEQN